MNEVIEQIENVLIDKEINFVDFKQLSDKKIEDLRIEDDYKDEIKAILKNKNRTVFRRCFYKRRYRQNKY